jgi:succinate dehydrogenase / fumarate reductase, cytochrome b subunit
MGNWFGKFLTSSIGQKVIMSLTGIFLILFLAVHLAGNLQLLKSDGGEAFNLYAYFMTHNPLIKTVSYGLYFFILLHTVQGLALWRKNRVARGDKGYAVKVTRTVGTSSFASKNMAWLGSIIFIFIGLHMYQFWLKMKLGDLAMMTYEGQEVANLYALVNVAFADPVYVVIYVVSMIVIAFHLWHGFQSSFQTLGLEHRKYTPVVKAIGKVYSVLVPLGFAAIPLYMYFLK